LRYNLFVSEQYNTVVNHNSKRKTRTVQITMDVADDIDTTATRETNQKRKREQTIIRSYVTTHVLKRNKDVD
jgi:hypothetical protein